ncbi:MAG TPA: CHRD domain-containing protein [Gaiellaceae bacterium]
MPTDAVQPRSRSRAGRCAGRSRSRASCTTTSAALAAAIVRRPAAYYVNVHNAKYPGGALRGQLRGDG